LALNAGDAYLDVHSKLAAGFGRQLATQVQGPAGRAGEEASRHFGRRFAHGLKVAGVAIAAGLGVATFAAARGANALVRSASDLNEQVSKTNVIFGRSAPVIQKWSRTTATSMGLSRKEALAAASSFGDMFLQLKIGRGESVKMSTKLVGLSADLASFHNVSGGAAEVSQMLSSAFRGEYDSLQRLIPNINAARVEQEAMRMTGKKSAKDLTAAEKAQATYAIVLRDSTAAQGDFSRTSNGLANQQRILSAQWADMKARLGTALLPVWVAFAKIGTEQLMPMLSKLWHEHGPGVQKALLEVAGGIRAMIGGFQEGDRTTSGLAGKMELVGIKARTLVLGIRALVAAYKDGDVTSDGFVGGMERIGVALARINWQRVRDGARDFFERLKDLGPTLKATNVQAGSLPPVLNVAGAGFKLIADHSGFLARHLGVLVGAFVAYKAVQAASNAADVARVAMLPAQIAATFLLARANKALAASQAGVATTAGAATVAQGRLTAANVAGTAAAGGLAAKTTLLGRAVGLLGRVGGPMVALSAVTAVATENFKRFREDGIHAKLIDPGTLAVTKLKDAFVFLRDKIGGTDSKGARESMARFNAISATARDTVRDFSGQVDGGTGKLVRINTALGRANVTAAASTVEFRKLVTQANSAQLDTARARQDQLAKGMGRAKVSAADAAREFRGFGRDAAAAIAKAKGKRFAVTAVADVDLTRRTIKLNNQFGGKILLAEGGWVWGPGTATSDSVRARLSRGEFVVNARSAARHRGTLEAINEQRFAEGGPVMDARATLTPGFRQLHRLDDLGTRVAQNVAGRTAKAVGTRVADGILGRIAATGTGAGGGSARGLVGFAAAAFRFWRRMFPWMTIGGWRARGSVPGSDHPKGKALDLMTSNRALHNRIISIFQGQAGAKYWISYRRIGLERQNWAPYHYGGPDPHTSHPHLSYYDKGGWLPPRSTTIAVNRTSQWEPVGQMGVDARTYVTVEGSADQRTIAHLEMMLDQRDRRLRQLLKGGARA